MTSMYIVSHSFNAKTDQSNKSKTHDKVSNHPGEEPMVAQVQWPTQGCPE